MIGTTNYLRDLEVSPMATDASQPSVLATARGKLILALLAAVAFLEAPDQGWGAASTIAELTGALVLLAAFVINERRVRNPLLPPSIFRVKGLAAADTTQLVAFA